VVRSGLAHVTWVWILRSKPETKGAGTADGGRWAVGRWAWGVGGRSCGGSLEPGDPSSQPGSPRSEVRAFDREPRVCFGLQRGRSGVK
jgi:hypothetical protein